MSQSSRVVAYCWATGEVGYGQQAPKGTLIIGFITTDNVPTFEAHCRRAYDNQTLLVPGVPECGDDQSKALDALHKFQDRLISIGVINKA